ncbi:MAG: penicillin acylase family protein, partial [Candidatus Thorarchaeota archaeon]
EGNIAMTVTGRFPIRSGYSGLFPVTALNDSIGMVSNIPFAHLPREINPSRGFVTSTNQRSIDPSVYNYTLVGPFSDGYRSRRISELLSEDSSVTVEDMMRFQADATEIRARSIVPIVISAWDDAGDGNATLESLVDFMRDWDFEMVTDLEAPTIWMHLYDALRFEIFDELHFLESILTTADQKSIALPSNVYPRAPIIEQLVLDGNSSYFDDLRTTDEIEMRDEILVRVLHRTLNSLIEEYGSDSINWVYGLHHTLNIDHMAGLTTIEGGAIRGQHTLFPSHGWDMSVGPVYRYVLDLSNRMNSRIVVAGGQSGNIFSSHFDDLFQLYFEFDEVTRHYQYHEVYAYVSVAEFLDADIDDTMVERRINLVP